MYVVFIEQISFNCLWIAFTNKFKKIDYMQEIFYGRPFGLW